MTTTKPVYTLLHRLEPENDQQKLWECDWNTAQFYWYAGLIHPFFMPWSLLASISAIRLVLKDYWRKCNDSEINSGKENR